MKPDYETAALKATEIITTRNISTAPVDPMPILKKMPNVLLVSYAEMAVKTGIARENVVEIFGEKNMDAATSVVNDNGKLR